jgi:proline iminopeptidase
MDYLRVTSGILSVFLATIFIACCCGFFVVNCSKENNDQTFVKEFSMEEGYVTTNDGVQLFYQKIGDSQSTVIIPNALYLFEDFKYLAADHTLIFYDMRNRGRSDNVIESQKLSRGIHHDVEDLETIRKHFGREKVHLIGHSYLGLMVFLYTTTYQDHVARVVQIGPMQFNLTTQYPKHLTANDETPVPDPKKMEELTNLEASGYTEANPKEYSRKWWSIIRSVYVTNPKDTVKIFSAIDEFPNEWPTNQMKHLTEYIMPSIQTLDVKKEQIEKCKSSVLTIHGTKDRAVPYGAGREWVFSLPDARLVTIDEGGHMPWIEAPSIVFPAIRTFLKGEWPGRAEEINVADFK